MKNSPMELSFYSLKWNLSPYLIIIPLQIKEGYNQNNSSVGTVFAFILKVDANIANACQI